MLLNHSFLQSVLNDLEHIGANFPEGARFSVDSRTINPGDIFVALAGNRVDGHLFIESAIKSGAAGLLLAKSNKSKIDLLDTKLKKELFIGFVSNRIKP